METTDALAIERIITTASEYGASDLHLSAGNPPIIRTDGKLVALEGEPIVTPDTLETLLGMLVSKEQRQALERDRELVLSATLRTQLRIKANLYYQKGTLAASIRFIPSRIRSVRELGLPPIIERFADLRKGLVLFTGPFGSGRTATLAAIIDAINANRPAHIVTIEKPIEYLYIPQKSIIEQREVGRDATSFDAAFAAASGEDVDVIVVSEMEEPRVVRGALAAAAASRLVLSTMNTDSVLRTIERIFYSFPSEELPQIRAQLAEALEGVVSQRLLPRVGGGRIAVAEILMPTSAVRSILRDGALFQLQTILQTSREAGMMSLDRSLAELIKTGEILLDDALAVCIDRAALQAMTRTY